MPSYTLTSMRTAVRERGDLPLVRKFSNAFIDREIQGSWAALHRVIETANEGYWDTSSTVTTTSGIAFVALPATAWKVKGLDVLIGGDYREVRQVPTGVRNHWSVADRGEPQAYRLTERGIDLFPTPGAAYTLRVTFARKVVALGGTAVDIDEEWADFVVWSTILKVSTSEERPTGDYIRARDVALEGVLAGVSGRKQAEPEYLILREVDELGGGWY